MTLQVQPAGGGAAVPMTPTQITGFKTDLALNNVDNTSDAMKPISTAQAAVNTAQATKNTSTDGAVAALTNSVAGKLDAGALGGAAALSRLHDLAAGAQIHKAGHTVLILGASTNARANNYYVVQNRSTYSRTSGVAQFDVSNFADAEPGKIIKIACNNAMFVTAFAIINTITDLGSGVSRITATELYTAAPRRNITAGSLPSTSVHIHDMSSCSNTHSWIARVCSMRRGNLDFWNLAVGGTVPTDFLDAEFIAYVQGMGMTWDTLIADFGTGNRVTGPTESSETIIGELNQCLTWATQLARDTKFLGIGGARIPGTPPLLPDYTTMARLNHFKRQFLAEKWPTVDFIDLQSRFIRPGMRGIVTTADMAAGLPDVALVDDNGDPHWAPRGSREVSIAVGNKIIPRGDVGWTPGAGGQPDTVFINTAGDFGGGYNPSGYVSPSGTPTLVQVDVKDAVGTVLAANIGQGLQGTEVIASGLGAGMSAAIIVRASDDASLEQILTFTDLSSSGGAAIELRFHGSTAHPIKEWLNDSRFIGVDNDLWGDIGLYGFEQDSIGRVDMGLWGVSVAGGSKRLGHWFCDEGVTNMFGVQRTWQSGFDGWHRAGAGKIRIPQRTYTDAYIRLFVQGVSGNPMGTLSIRLGEIVSRLRQNLG